MTEIDIKKDGKEQEEKGIAFELLQEVRVQAKRWMAAFFTILFLWMSTIIGFLLFINQYDFQSYEQDGSGYNNINTGEQGDVINGAEVPNSEEEKR